MLAPMPLDDLNSRLNSIIPLRVFKIWNAFLGIQVQMRRHTVWKVEAVIALERVSNSSREREREINRRECIYLDSDIRIRRGNRKVTLLTMALVMALAIALVVASGDGPSDSSGDGSGDDSGCGFHVILVVF